MCEMEGWKDITIESSCLIKKGVQFNRLELDDTGTYPCINGGISPSGYSDLYNTESNTITISEGGESCGYVAKQQTKFWCGGHCYALLNVNDKLQLDFFFYALKGRETQIMDLRVGSGLPNIQLKAIKKFEFVYPTSKAEQRKIAEILSTLDKAIEQTEALIAKYKNIKKGLMHDLLSYGIDKNGNIRNPKTHKFKNSDLGLIPHEWSVQKLNNCIQKNTTITYGIVQTFEHIEDGIPVLRTIDLKENGINSIDNLLRTKKAISDSYKRTILTEGDIVCNVRASVGDFNIVTADYQGCNTTRGVARICLLEGISNQYMYWFLNSYKNQKQMEFYIKGTTFIDINIADLRNILVLLPERDEQDSIAVILSSQSKLIKAEETNLAKLQKQKQGLMQDLLTGKVRVKI